MPKRTPSYRQRPGYDQAIVTLSDSVTKKRRDYWLDKFDSPASRERYHRLIAEWESRGRRLPAPDFDRPPADVADCITVDEVALRFWRWAKGYYQTRHGDSLKVVIRLLRQYYGQTPAAEFGPSKLRLLRDEMIRGDESADPPRVPWSRRYVNQQTQRELDEALERAPRQREEGEDEPGSPRRTPQDLLDEFQDRVAGLGQALARGATVRGTFNAAAAQGLLGTADAQKRTADATEQTARNTKRLVDAARNGGLVFT